MNIKKHRVTNPSLNKLSIRLPKTSMSPELVELNCAAKELRHAAKEKRLTLKAEGGSEQFDAVIAAFNKLINTQDW